MPYLKLLHGRKQPDVPMEDWGEPGPIFGPFPDFHATYGCEINFDDGVLNIIGNVVYYDGLFYGDWSVFDGPPSEDDADRLTEYDVTKAEVPEWFQQCPCEQPGYFDCGVPGIIAHLENGRISPVAKVERCDQCERYPDDAATRQKLIGLGLIWQPDPPPTHYSVHCYVTVRVKLAGLPASTPQDAARLADALFNWNEHHRQAEFVDEVTEYLVDVDGAADFSESRRFNADFEEVET